MIRVKIFPFFFFLFFWQTTDEVSRGERERWNRKMNLVIKYHGYIFLVQFIRLFFRFFKFFFFFLCVVYFVSFTHMQISYHLYFHSCIQSKSGFVILNLNSILMFCLFHGKYDFFSFLFFCFVLFDAVYSFTSSLVSFHSFNFGASINQCCNANIKKSIFFNSWHEQSVEGKHRWTENRKNEILILNQFCFFF